MGALLGGILSDKLESKSYMSKAWLVIGSNLFSSPFAFLAFMNQDSFWYSMGMVNFQWFLSEAWFAPTLVMLQNTTSQRNQGSVVSIYYLLTTLTGIIGTSVLGQWTDLINAAEHPELYGYTLTAVVVAAQVGCTPFFYFAGRAYTKYMSELDASRAVAAGALSPDTEEAKEILEEPAGSTQATEEKD